MPKKQKQNKKTNIHRSSSLTKGAGTQGGFADDVTATGVECNALFGSLDFSVFLTSIKVLCGTMRKYKNEISSKAYENIEASTWNLRDMLKKEDRPKFPRIHSTPNLS